MICDLIGGNWVREAMNLTGDNDYVCRSAMILLLSAVVLAVVISGLIMKVLAVWSFDYNGTQMMFIDVCSLTVDYN